MHSIYFINDKIGWIAGKEGVVLNTMDGGDKWRLQTSCTYNRLNGVHFASSRIGWIVGESGTIIKTINGGPTSIEDKQNFTSPTQKFNIRTNNYSHHIKKVLYTLPYSSRISLKVYDMHGKVITTGINEFHEAGTYSYDFNTSELTSGLYMFRLQAGPFEATQKVHLVK